MWLLFFAQKKIRKSKYKGKRKKNKQKIKI